MCGRFTASDPKRIAEEFQLPFPEGPPRWNIAPTQDVPVILNREPRAISWARFGFKPGTGKLLLNARSETLGERFRGALEKRRCLVLADGFFEWKRDGKLATPYYVRLRDHRPFSFAGLWNAGKDGNAVTIVTGPPNAVVAPIHSRMPIIIDPADRERWLAADAVDVLAFDDLFAPSAPEDWIAYPVSSVVNSVANDGPECIAPGATQPSLF